MTTGSAPGSAARLTGNGGALRIHAPALSLPGGVLHGVTHASLGNFSLRATADAARVEARRERLLADAGLSGARVVAPRLEHGATVAVIRPGCACEEPADAVIAQEHGVVLAVTVADCVPVFAVDVGTGAFGVAHAGWRGLVAGVVGELVNALRSHFESKPGEILLATGPAIRGQKYAVGAEVAGLFPEPFSVPVDREGHAAPPGDAQADHYLLDLPSCALAEARAAGIPPDNLVDFSLCTASHPDDLFSHRRGDRARHWAFIARRRVPDEAGETHP